MTVESIARRADRIPTTGHRSPCDLEVIVPAFNEERRLPSTLRALSTQLARLEHLRCRIVIVDNASSDRTADVADVFAATESAVEVITIGCAIKGKGAAVRRGVMTSRARFLGFFDADLATPAEAIIDALALLEDGAAVVIASRRVDGAQYAVRQPLGRRVASWAFHRAIRDLLPGVSDTQCGFKFFTRAAAQRAFAELHTPGYTFDVELLMRTRAGGHPVTELPVVWTDDAESSLKTFTEAPRIFAELVGLRRLGSRIAA